MKKAQNERRYVTKQIATLIQESDYKRKDDLYCIVDQVYRRQIFFKNELQKRYGFIEIPKSVFQKLIAKSENVTKAIEFLIDKQIILRNDYFVYGVKAKGYKIKTEFLGSKIEVEITDKNINARIKKLKLANRKKRVKNLEFTKSVYYKTFKIDRHGALEASKEKAIHEIENICQLIRYSIPKNRIEDIIECQNDYVKSRTMILVHENGKQLNNILHRLMVHQLQINAIADGFLYFSRNKTNGRLDTNLTSLPSYLRKFIKSDEKLYHLDIKNSQPFFLFTKLLNEPNVDKDELELYKKLTVGGTFYEFLIDGFEMESKGLDAKRLRDKIKKKLFGIFYSKVSSFENDKAKFRKLFPTIMNYIDMNNFENHKTLAIAMQERESYCILDNVMVKLQRLGVNPFTIHDSFIMTESELPIVKEVFNQTLTEMFGIVPQVHEDPLFDLEENECEDKMLDDDYDLPNSFYAA